MNTTDKKPIATIGLNAQLIIKRLETAEIGEVVTYDELEIITKEPSREKIRSHFYTAKNRMFKENGWLFGCVENVGYKRLDASEKMDEAESKRKHIHKTAVKSGQILASIEVKDLPQAEQVRHNLETSFAGALALATSRKNVAKITDKAQSAPLPGPEVLALFAK